jgi:hypothetical protein
VIVETPTGKYVGHELPAGPLGYAIEMLTGRAAFSQASSAVTTG